MTASPAEGAAFVICPTLVGREAELSRLLELLAAVPPGRLVCVGGDAGVGKSRLIAEFSRAASAAGATLLTGNCRPDSGVAYSVFVSLLRRFTRTLPPEEIERLFDGPARLSSVLLPELNLAPARSPGNTPAKSLLTPAAVGAEDLAASFWHVLARLPRSVVILEDMHWADADSLRLLAYLAREIADLPLLLVASYRTDELHRRHPLSGLLGELARARLYDDFRLEPLPRAELRTMLADIFEGLTLSDDFLDTLQERTDGNPFFVEELAKTLVERGDIYRRDEGWDRRPQPALELPLTVRETLLARMKGLPSELGHVLHLAALSGERIDVDVLASAVHDDALVDAAIAAGIEHQLLVEERGREGARYVFRHALTREAAIEQLVGPERRRAHRTIADALETVYPDRLDDVAAELADHLIEAGELTRAAEAALRAARRAVANGAPDEAARRFDQTIQWLPHDSADRLPILLEAARGTVEAEDVSKAAAFAREARQLAHERGEPALEAEARWTLASELHLLGDTPSAIAMLEEALPLVTGVDDWREAWTLRLLTRTYVLADRNQDAAPLLARAKEVATRAGHHLALSGVFNTEMLMARTPADFDAAFQRAVAEARAAGDIGAEVGALVNRGYHCVWTGQFQTAYESLARGVELSRSSMPGSCKYYEAGLAWAAALVGRLTEAQQLAEPFGESGEVPVRLVALSALAEVADRTGRDDEARRYAEVAWELASLTGESQRIVPAAAALARIALRTPGRPVSESGPRFWDALRHTTDDLGFGSHWMFSPEYAWALAATGENADVTELNRWVAAVDALTAKDDSESNTAASLLCRASQERIANELAQCADDLTAALKLFEAMPYPARQVETLIELARAEAALGRDEDAIATARRAHGRARDLGALRLVDAASDLVDALRGGTVVATVLFTDIVGSTEQAAAMGDLAWSNLLNEHNQVVRSSLARFGGREIDNAGDGFLSAFDSPTRAIRCSSAILAGLQAVGIRARAALHTGECRQVGSKLTGLAVHVAARVLALADAGDILVSGTVRDLLVGSDIEFDDRGAHVLRGVPGEWRVFSVAG